MSRLYGPVVQVCYLVDEIEAGIHYWSDTLGAGPFFVLPPRRFEWLAVHGRPTGDHAIIADVALGYAGWGGGQLDEEMTRHGWLVVPGDPDILFDTHVEDRWTTSFRAAGIDPRLLTAQAGAA